MKKGFFSKILAKFDEKLEKKAKEKKNCCCNCDCDKE